MGAGGCVCVGVGALLCSVALFVAGLCSCLLVPPGLSLTRVRGATFRVDVRGWACVACSTVVVIDWKIVAAVLTRPQLAAAWQFLQEVAGAYDCVTLLDFKKHTFADLVR